MCLYFDNADIGENAMTEYDAMRVARFVEKHKDNADAFVIASDKGVSRSDGVVAVILKYLTGNDISILKSHKYSPNISCYNKTIAAFKNNKTLHRFQSNHLGLYGLRCMRAF